MHTALDHSEGVGSRRRMPLRFFLTPSRNKRSLTMRVRSISEEAERRAWDPAFLRNWELLLATDEWLPRREEGLVAKRVEEEGEALADTSRRPTRARRALDSRAALEEEAIVPSMSDAKAGREGPDASEGPEERNRGGLAAVGLTGVGDAMMVAEAVGTSMGDSLRTRASNEALVEARESDDEEVSALLSFLASRAAALFDLLASATSSDSADGDAYRERAAHERISFN